MYDSHQQNLTIQTAILSHNEYDNDNGLEVAWCACDNYGIILVLHLSTIQGQK